MLLYQTYIQAKTKDKETLTTPNAPLDTSNASKLQSANPQDPLCNLKAIKYMGTSLVWWAHNLLKFK
jgi:hypothetical protein